MGRTFLVLLLTHISASPGMENLGYHMQWMSSGLSVFILFSLDPVKPHQNYRSYDGVTFWYTHLSWKYCLVKNGLAVHRGKAICKLRREASGENNPPELWQSRGSVVVLPAAATKKPGSEMSDILWELLRVSERAANIAWECRQQEALFQLLTEEKKEAEKNKICTWFLNPGWCTGIGSYQTEYGEQVSRLGEKFFWKRIRLIC